MDIRQIDKQYVASTYARFDLQLCKGEGSTVCDQDGKKYIDLATGIAVNTFGYSDRSWQDAVTAQLGKIQHTSNLYYNEPCAVLAKMLCERTGMKRVFFGNSGAEANECAIKVARKYGTDKYGRSTVVTLKNSFHGRTVATLAATGQDVFHKDFGPFPDGFEYIEASDTSALRQCLTGGKVCALMMEMIQGEGGVMPLDRDFVRLAEKLCRENDVLLIVDEVQTGNGRTGELYAYMNYGITPDIVTTAKGLAGGLPMGACLMGEKTADVLSPGDHGSTFGGNPVCAAGAVNIISRIDGELLAGVKKRSEYIFGQLTGAKGVESVSGMGLMIGIKCEKAAKDVANECIKRGVLVITAKDRVRLLPALNIPEDQLAQSVDILKEVIAQ